MLAPSYYSRRMSVVLTHLRVTRCVVVADAGAGGPREGLAQPLHRRSGGSRAAARVLPTRLPARNGRRCHRRARQRSHPPLLLRQQLLGAFGGGSRSHAILDAIQVGNATFCAVYI